MPELRLAKLPDRVPVKLSISVSPELNRTLSEYAHAYEQVYGESQSATEPIPAMLETFLASDRAFARMRKEAGPSPSS